MNRSIKHNQILLPNFVFSPKKFVKNLPSLKFDEFQITSSGCLQNETSQKQNINRKKPRMVFFQDL